MGSISGEEARLARKFWHKRLESNPKLVCTHPNGFLKEYYLGTATGDHVCPDCGVAKEEL